MNQSSINVRAVVVYGLVGLAILALIIFGISWAKNRSDQIASQNQGQTAQEDQQGGDGQGGEGSTQPGQEGSQPQDDQEQQANGGQVSGAATTGPTEVPAAGPTDWPVLLGAVSLASFVGAKFWQSRRKLASLK